MKELAAQLDSDGISTEKKIDAVTNALTPESILQYTAHFPVTEPSPNFDKVKSDNAENNSNESSMMFEYDLQLEDSDRLQIESHYKQPSVKRRGSGPMNAPNELINAFYDQHKSSRNNMQAKTQNRRKKAQSFL